MELTNSSETLTNASVDIEGAPSAMDDEVIIVGAGPTGLMLAVELCLAGVRPLVLERQPKPRDNPKAGGLSGQILELLHYRGLLERFEAAGTEAVPAPRLPFGGLHVDFTRLDPPPMRLLMLQQPQLESLLSEIAIERGAEIRRGHGVLGLSQDDAIVTADVLGPDGHYQVTGQYIVGCDGSQSRVRDMADISFPGTTYPEVQRLAQFTVPESVTVLENGDLEVEGVGRFSFGFTRNDRGEYAVGSTNPEFMGLFTSEHETADYDDDEPMTVDEMRDSIRRVFGVELPLGEPTRLTRFTFHARHVQRYRNGRVLMAGDAAHLFPAPGVALNAGMMDSVNLAWKLAAAVDGWAPVGLLDSYHVERHLAGERTMLHTQAQMALRRGHDAAAEALRTLVKELLLDEQPQRRIGAFIAGTDIRYPSAGRNPHPLAGTFAPNLTLRSDPGTITVAELMHAARPVLLDLADRSDLREVARAWEHRIDIRTAVTDHRPADAVLIRPDAQIAWAAAVDEGSETAVPALREALATWFGRSLADHRPVSGDL